MGTGSAQSLFKSLLVSIRSESCWGLWYRRRGLKNLVQRETFQRKSKTTSRYNLSGKKMPKRWTASPARRENFRTALRRAVLVQQGFDWFATGYVLTWRKCSRDIWKLWFLYWTALKTCVPTGAVWSVKSVVAHELLVVGDEGWWWYAERNRNSLFWSGMVAWFDVY